MLKDLIMSETKHPMPVISKIEKPQAITKLESILKVSDGLMVARGDLGLEIPTEEVLMNQKIMVEMAKKARKPVIVATQMMESMIDNLTPSRAEVNDVANSVMDGADCIMLSGETSVGKYPCEVVRKIGKIISSVENADFGLTKTDSVSINKDRLITNSICYHAALLADRIKASAVCTLTNSGYTGWRYLHTDQELSYLYLLQMLKFYLNSIFFGVLSVYFMTNLKALIRQLRMLMSWLSKRGI